jgi:hypothetical protein
VKREREKERKKRDIEQLDRQNGVGLGKERGERGIEKGRRKKRE